MGIREPFVGFKLNRSKKVIKIEDIRKYLRHTPKDELLNLVAGINYPKIEREDSRLIKAADLQEKCEDFLKCYKYYSKIHEPPFLSFEAAQRCLGRLKIPVSVYQKHLNQYSEMDDFL